MQSPSGFLRRALLPGPAAILALLFAVPIALSPVKSFDLFFHLASGRYLLAHGFPAHDPFGATATHFPLHEWGFGALCALLVKSFGAAGVEVLTAACVTLAIGFTWRAIIQHLRGIAGIGLLFLVVYAMSPTFEDERPFHLSHALFGATLLIVSRWRRGHSPWILVPLTALWANLHGSFPIGPALLCGAAIGSLADENPNPGRIARAFGIATIAWIGAAISPGGLFTLITPIAHALLPSTQGILEWEPLIPEPGWARAFLVLFALTIAAWARAPRIRLASALPAGLLAIAAIGARRHVPLAAMALAWSAAEHIALRPLMMPEQIARIDGALARWSSACGGGLLALVALCAIAAQALAHPASIESRLYPGRVPLRAALALKSLPPGRVLARFRLGGFVAFAAGDGHPVFIDARNDPYPAQIHADYRTLFNVEPGWERVLGAFAPRYLLWSREDGGNVLLAMLQCRGGWRTLVDEPAGTLWIREPA